MTRTLIVDNHDSFTYNLFQLVFDISGVKPCVVTNDSLTWPALSALDFDNVILSPGPGRPSRPADFGVCADILAHETRPVLGVCLGHQGLWLAGGGVIGAAPRVMHGRQSAVRHDGRGLFEGLPSPFLAVRYHSLAALGDPPPDLRVTAMSDDGVVMGIEHRSRRQWGVQFHPESILTEHGRRLLWNFHHLTRAAAAVQAAAAARPSRRPQAAATARRRPPSPAGLSLVHAVIGRDLDPEAVFVQLYAKSSIAFWLDKCPHAGAGGRFSFMGDAGGPLAEVVRARATESTITRQRAGGEVERVPAELLDYLRDRLAFLRPRVSEAPFPFPSGYVGYLGYEMKARLGHAARHAAAYCDSQWILADRFVCFDHETGDVHAAVLAPSDAAENAQAWIAARRRDLAGPARAGRDFDRPDRAPVTARWRHDRRAYGDLIRRCQDEIAQGESYEICLTNRLSLSADLDPLATYRLLRRVNPAPHAAYLRFGDLSVLCSSPERFLGATPDGWVEARPIKGTRRRGATPAEDLALARDLASAEKDRAENLMITDLLRNDLGAVCDVGTVHVPALMQVETYRSAHQLVSTVRGRLAAGRDIIDCIAAAFPGGSMTGAPKRRTMEIIDRLEDGPRGVYSGALGYIGLDGSADLNIVIRTIVMHGSEITIGAGGAIVALSDTEAEIDEVDLKAAALVEALELSAGLPIQEASRPVGPPSSARERAPLGDRV